MMRRSECMTARMVFAEEAAAGAIERIAAAIMATVTVARRSQRETRSMRSLQGYSAQIQAQHTSRTTHRKSAARICRDSHSPAKASLTQSANRERRQVVAQRQRCTR